MQDILSIQLSIDYCCSPEQVRDHENHFTIYTAQEGRRKFQEQAECFLKIAAVNGKLLFTGRDDIISHCRSRYRDTSGEWFMEAKGLVQLEQELNRFGYRIEQAHPFFATGAKSEVNAHPFEIVRYEKSDIEQFREDKRFSDAFAFCEDAPDELGIAAVMNGTILGMAGASSDSPTMWQIGINVTPEARRKHVGTTLVTLLKNELIDMGKLPYYGTAMSHTVSQRVAVKAGFLPAWSELVCSPLPGNPKA